jgi:elongation factor Ts
MISAQDVYKLREETQAPVMECKKALEESQGDFEKAKLILKKKGEIRGAKKQASTEEIANGIIDAYIHAGGQIGAMVELRCQTDFVAKNRSFQELAHDLAMHIAALNPLYLSRASIPSEEIERKKEAYLKELEGSNKPPEMLDKIIEGKLEKEIAEICLENQMFIKDDTRTIGDLIKEAAAKFGEKIEISKFVRFEI